jgi:hypothetical protein
MARLDELEEERRTAAERVLRGEDVQDRVRVLQAVTEADVALVLATVAEGMATLDRDALKDVLRAWIGRIELDPATRTGRVVYRLTLTRDKVASPPRHGANPLELTAVGSELLVPRKRGRGVSRREPLGRTTWGARS